MTDTSPTNPNSTSPPQDSGFERPQVLQVQATRSWQAPYPPPDAVERYEKIMPGTFNRMISMGERLQAAQIDENKRAQDYAHADQKRGHYLGAAVTVVAMIGAVACLEIGSPWVAGIFLSVPVMSVARSFIEVARSRSERQAARDPDLPLTPTPNPPTAPAG